MNLYEDELQNARVNCAIEKTLIESGDNFLFFTTLQESVFIGTDITMLSYIENVSVPLARYNGTGGPVYFNEGNVKVSFLIDNQENAQDICSQWIIKSLADLGVLATYAGNDIYFDGKKICGIGNKVIVDKIFLPFFFSLNIDFETAAEVMNLTKHTTNLAERATGINQFAENTITSAEILNALKLNFSTFWGDEQLRECKLTDINYEENLNLMNSEEWIKYGKIESKPDFI